MSAAWVWARSELGRRWKATAVLAVLVGLVGGVAMFGVAGYRRTASAMDRFLDYSRPTNAFVYAEDLDLDSVEALDQVVDADAGAYFLMAPTTADGDPDPALGINPFSSSRGRLLTSIDRPLVVSGRLPDHAEILEVAVNEELAEARGLGAGDTLVMWAYDRDQFFELLEAVGTLPPEGPRLELKVTAVIRHPRDVAPYASDDEVAYLSKQNLFLTEAFHQRYVDELANFNQAGSESLGVRLAGGQADVAAFADAVRALPGGSETDVDPEVSARQALSAGQRAIDLQALGLLVFAVLVAVAGAAVVGQSLVRQIQLSGADHASLRALGLTPGELGAALAVQALVVGLAGTVVATAVALALSPLAPIGVARAAEISPGFAVDLAVLTFGALGVLGVVMARVAGPVWRAAHPPSPGSARWSPSSGSHRPLRTAERLAGAGAPVSAVTGVRMALQAGQGDRAVPVHTAVAGGAVALVAVAGALVFAASLDRLVASPVLQGWNWDVVVGDGNVDNLDKGRTLLPATPVVGGFTAISQPNTFRVAGVEVGVTGLLPLENATGPAVLDGRLPQGGDEIALGRQTMEGLGVEIGDQIDVTVDGSDARWPFTVVGTVLVGNPALNFEADGLGLGAVIPFERMEALFGEVQAAAFLVDYADGVDPDLAFAALQADWGKTVLRAVAPDQVENLRRVAGLPLLFAILLAVLAVATLGHALLTAIRHRRRELATLKALGFVRRQIAATVAWQATTLVVVVLVVGLPLGVALGRWGWRVVADGVGTPAPPVTPLVAVALAVPVAILVANALAALPARRAARTRPAVALRAE